MLSLTNFPNVPNKAMFSPNLGLDAGGATELQLKDEARVEFPALCGLQLWSFLFLCVFDKFVFSIYFRLILLKKIVEYKSLHAYTYTTRPGQNCICVNKRGMDILFSNPV